MKTIVLAGLALILFTACENNKKERYAQNSPEIDSFKAALADYEAANWEGYMSHYSDTAKIYVNSDDIFVSPADNVAIFKEQNAPLSSYGFVKDKGDIEMVVTDDGETWVNYWGVWSGTMSANNKTFVIPVHLTAEFVDGKIVKEHGYWDSSEIMMATMAMDTTKMEMDKEMMEDKKESIK